MASRGSFLPPTMLEPQVSLLLNLPQELIVELLSHLDYRSLLRCCAVRGLSDLLQLCCENDEISLYYRRAILCGISAYISL